MRNILNISWKRSLRLAFVNIMLFLMLSSAGLATLMAQVEHTNYRYEDGHVIVVFDHLQDTAKLNEILSTIGSSCEMTDSLNDLNEGKRTPLGWELVSWDPNKIEYKKEIKALASGSKSDYFYEENISFDKNAPYDLNVKFGRNLFNQNTLISEGGDLFTFQLFGFPNAKKVNLASSFNNWSTINTAMVKEGKVWKTTIKLNKGKHLYKFIVDGEWMTDPANALEEKDHHGNTNSVFFNYNHTFKLEGHQEAKQVFLAGDFNNWNPSEFRMLRNNNGWEIPVYLREGEHNYKFIIDGKWVLDPKNAKKRSDGKGNENSVLFLGDPIIFQTSTFPKADELVLTGNFNGWDKNDLRMKKEKDGWSVPLSLKPGNYEYKFVVDKKWKVDPSNPHTIGRRKFKNSICSIEPNHTFVLGDHAKAKKVLVTGTFNNWSTTGYTMERKLGRWEITIHLPKGKTRYKFIVDGEWISDEANPLWEKNQYDTKDSILWME